MSTASETVTGGAEVEDAVQEAFAQVVEKAPALIAGFDAAWAFYGGVFAVVIPDNPEKGACGVAARPGLRRLRSGP